MEPGFGPLDQCLLLTGRRPDSPILEVDAGERLPAGVADDEAGVGLLGGPGRRESAGQARLFT
jgi:hypothetical protein